MIPAAHPYWHVCDLLKRHIEIVAVSVSYYTYTPKSIEDRRTNWEISITDFFDSGHIAQIMEKTPSGQELAFHSNVRLGTGEYMHLIMIDMSTTARAHLEKLRAFLGDNCYQKIVWYSSGRSFHGYGSALLTESEWYKFMGILLLANQPNLEPTVDPRWIGHRLLAGYAALRWTKNTSLYLGPPSRLIPNSRGHRLA